MAATQPPDSAPSASPGEEPAVPPAPDAAGLDSGSPDAKKRRNPWLGATVALAIVCVGLLVWGLTTKSDLDDTQADLAAAQGQVKQSKATGSAAVSASNQAYEDLANQLGATNEDLTATKQDLKAAEQAAAQADKNAEKAKKDAASASNQTQKAKAEADQAKAEAKAAESQAAIATDCANAYLSVVDTLATGSSDQAAAAQRELDSISQDCKTALNGS